MKIADIIKELEQWASPALQESYDNAKLLTGQKDWTCTKILCSLDCTEDIVNEAINSGANLIVAHHPIIFKGLKSITGANYIERTIIKAIKNDIAIYAIHTNLDNIQTGVNHKIAEKLGLTNYNILDQKLGQLRKLFVFVPETHSEEVLKALYQAGAGNIGKYDHCSFKSAGEGSFRPKYGADPYLGKIGEVEKVPEHKLEILYPQWKESAILKAMFEAHPYEEIAYDIVSLNNVNQEVGSGMIGELPTEMDEKEFLQFVKSSFQTGVIRHTKLLGKPIKRVALCGGAGIFLISNALQAGADAFITADIKYHEFFDADNKLLLADIGHYESEQYTIELLQEFLQQKFPNFAVLKTAVSTNPVYYC